MYAVHLSFGEIEFSSRALSGFSSEMKLRIRVFFFAIYVTGELQLSNTDIIVSYKNN